MRDASCHREDIIAAFEDLCRRLEDRQTSLWASYSAATSELSPTEYAEFEVECWHVLEAGLAGITAERKMLEHDVHRRLALLEDEGAVA